LWYDEKARWMGFLAEARRGRGVELEKRGERGQRKEENEREICVCTKHVYVYMRVCVHLPRICCVRLGDWVGGWIFGEMVKKKRDGIYVG
jgi:hypothetical protein